MLWDLWRVAEGCPLSWQLFPLEGAASSLHPGKHLGKKWSRCYGIDKEKVCTSHDGHIRVWFPWILFPLQYSSHPLSLNLSCEWSREVIKYLLLSLLLCYHEDQPWMERSSWNRLVSVKRQVEGELTHQVRCISWNCDDLCDHKGCCGVNQGPSPLYCWPCNSTLTSSSQFPHHQSDQHLSWSSMSEGPDMTPYTLDNGILVCPSRS